MDDPDPSMKHLSISNLRTFYELYFLILVKIWSRISCKGARTDKKVFSPGPTSGEQASTTFTTFLIRDLHIFASAQKNLRNQAEIMEI